MRETPEALFNTDDVLAFGREMIDAATFGGLKASAPQHIKEAAEKWNEQNSGKAELADFIGQYLVLRGLGHFLGRRDGFSGLGLISAR